jgi:quinol monooxygenase YgiN
MKQLLLLMACMLTVLTACCESKTQGACADEGCVAKKDSFEIIMNIPVKIKPEHVSAYKAAFDKCQAATLKEEACLAYDLFQSYKDSTEFHLFERWTNKPGHQNHMQTEHIKVFFQEIKGMQETARTKMITTTVCPKINQ